VGRDKTRNWKYLKDDRSFDRASVQSLECLMKYRLRVRSLVRIFAVLVLTWAILVGTVAAAMLQPPERFGLFMRHVPMLVVWGLTPAKRIWLWARQGTLREGDLAPDFSLATVDHRGQVTLSEHRGHRPVVLVFGSYT
jgi:hypothetical protein